MFASPAVYREYKLNTITKCKYTYIKKPLPEIKKNKQESILPDSNQ